MKLTTCAYSLTTMLIVSSLHAETKTAPAVPAKPTAAKPGVAVRPAPTIGNMIAHPFQTMRGFAPAPAAAAHPAVMAPARAFPQTRASVVRPTGISQRIAGCAGRAGGSCAVWRSFGSAPDQAQLVAARQQAFRQGSFYTNWVGADGVRRQVWVSAGPTQMVNVVIPVVAVSAAAVAVVATPGAPAAYYSPPSTGIVAASVNPNAAPAATALPSGEAATDPQTAAPAPGGTGAAVSSAGSAPAAVAMGSPQRRVCRQVNTQATASGQQDMDMTLYCRNDDGDWVEATPVVASN
jgi:hypothetical protein